MTSSIRQFASRVRSCGIVFLALVAMGSLVAQDQDEDGVLDDVDNCLQIWNPGQSDSDGDNYGNACECGKTAATFRAAGARVRFVAMSDLDDDGVPDALLSEPHCQDCAAAGCSRQTGQVSVVSGRALTRLYEVASPETCDEFGTALADAGDVNGDNTPDFLVGAEAGAEGHGRAYLYSGATGQLLFDVDGALLSGPSSGSRYGAQVVGVGDFNGDQFADFAVAAPEATVGPLRRGRVYFYRGGPAGQIALEQTTSARAGGEAFGASLDAGSDFDGDGDPDLAVGAPPLGAGPLGHAYVFSLVGRGLVFEVEGPASEAIFGTRVALTSDTNGDGRGDLLVGAPSAPRSSRAGEIHLYTGGDPDAEGDAAPHSIGIITGEPGGGLGTSLADLGDVDGDGFADFAAGVPDGAEGVGQVKIFSGKSQVALPDFRGSGSAKAFGIGVARAGDIDGNDVQDLLVADRRAGARASLYLMGDVDGNGQRDACQSCPTPTPLAVGIEHSFEICPVQREKCFLVEGVPGQSWRVTLASDDEDFRATLRLRWDEPPGGGNTDATGHIDETTGLRTLLTPVREGQAYLVVQLFGRGACAENVRLHVETFDGPVVGTVTPRFVGAGRPIGIAVTGVGFAATHQFSLSSRVGDATFSGVPTLVSSELAEVQFDLTSAPIASYDLVVSDAGAEVATLQGAFQVRSFQDSDLSVTLRGSPFFRRTDPKGQLTLRYVNTGEDVLVAPLLNVRPVGAGPGTQLRLQGEHRNLNVPQLQLLGVHSEGLPHLLPPGAEEEITVVFNTGISCDLCSIVFNVQVFTPDARDFIDWSSFPNPDPDNVSEEAWLAVRPALSVNLGRTWLEYQEALGQRARRLSHLRASASSVAQLFQFAFAEAAGRPHTSIAGVVLLAEEMAPLPGASIAAFSGDELRAITEARSDGSFVLGGLEAVQTYRLAVSGFSLVGDLADGLVTTPPESFSEDGTGDLLNTNLDVVAGGEMFAPVEIEPAPGLPAVPPVPPETLFSTTSVWETQVVASQDPNKKTDCVLPGDALFTDDEDDDAPAGGGGEQASKASPIIDYTIFFENSRCATAAAQHVRIIDTLDAAMFDISSIRLTDISLGEDSIDKLIVLDEPIWDTWNVVRTLTDVPVANLSPLRVLGDECDDGALPECDGSEDNGSAEDANGAGLDVEFVNVRKITVDIRLEEVPGENKYELTWTLQTNAFGFLPPNDCATHQGEGFVSFRIQPAAGMETAQLENDVEVLFDGDAQRAISLSVTTDLMPSEPPSSLEHPVPVDNPGGDVDLLIAGDQSLSWEPILADHCRVSVWRLNDGVREAVIEEHVLTTSSYFPEEEWELATTYEWEVVAVNAVGETKSPTWTFVTAGLPADVPGFVALSGPADASDVPTDFVLEWNDAEGASTYSLYVWESGEERGRPVAHVGSLTDYVPTGLEPGKTYNWQVVATNEGGETESQVWAFATGTTTFLRGDVDANGEADITDAISLLNHLFLGGVAPTCASAADVDDSGNLVITDGIALLNFLFGGGEAIAAPSVACGFDTTPDDLTCEAFAACP